MSEQVRRKLKAAMQELDSTRAENRLLKHKLGRLLGAEQEWELVEPGEYARLKAEVERLRNAGDDMADALNLNDDVFDNQEKREAQAKWNAAKEGKPSK